MDGSAKEPDVHQWGTAPDFQGPRHELREELLLDEFLAASPGPLVLDVGAGSGTFTDRLATRGFEVTSTDVTDDALEVLRGRVSGTVERADASSLPFSAASFDAVVLGEVLEHVEDDSAALKEAARVLRPDGILAVTVPRNPAWFSRSDQWAGHFRRYTRGQLENRVAMAGFEILTCKAWGFPISALYHRTVFEWIVARHATSSAPLRAGSPILGALLRLDRHFLGHERGALGYILVAVASSETFAGTTQPPL
ncbi:MAG TPA: class I SAM-dependent methyltransferase [Polyangiaceae bacterium]|nr:class I SAM-dependent methyltransferase [Polyangiaceae bacterium]